MVSCFCDLSRSIREEPCREQHPYHSETYTSCAHTLCPLQAFRGAHRHRGRKGVRLKTPAARLREAILPPCPSSSSSTYSARLAIGPLSSTAAPSSDRAAGAAVILILKHEPPREAHRPSASAQLYARVRAERRQRRTRGSYLHRRKANRRALKSRNEKFTRTLLICLCSTTEALSDSQTARASCR